MIYKKRISVLITYSDKNGVLAQRIVDRVPDIILSDSIESDKIIKTIEQIIGDGTVVQIVLPMIYKRK